MKFPDLSKTIEKRKPRSRMKGRVRAEYWGGKGGLKVSEGQE